MPDMMQLFREFASVAGISGCEQRTAALVRRMAEPYVDEIRTDTMGNVICHKKGPGKRILLAAHMDVVGFYVRGIDEKGNVYVDFSGGVNKSCIWNRAVRFENGAWGVVRPVVADVEKEPGNKKASEIIAEDLFIETGAETYEEAMKLVSIGESAVWEGETCRCGMSRIMSPYIDDAAGSITLLKMMERLQNCPNDLWFAFTVCEEIGSFGAKTVIGGIDCNYAISVDVAPATDALSGNADHFRLSLGKGPALTLREHGFIANPEFRGMLTAVAERESIPYQAKLSRGGTDAKEFASAKAGTMTMSVGIPHRYIHTPNEIIDERDIDAVCDLLCAFVQSEL